MVGPSRPMFRTRVHPNYKLSTGHIKTVPVPQLTAVLRGTRNRWEYTRMKAHLVSHTHWDREWYRTYQEFRILLVRLLDDLLDLMESDPEYKHFMLDGQTVQLEDYLEIRPENKERLRAQIQAGRLSIGPMYTQPDEYVPSGESLVRNFLVAKHVAESFGPMMPIGYFPDSFGHASQIPQILRGLGIETAVFWRGVCDEDTTKTEFWWESREGSRVLAIRMPYAYGNAYIVPLEPDRSAEFFESAVQSLTPMATTDNVLLMRGWDHSGADPETPELIRAASERLTEDIEIVHSSLEDLAAAVRTGQPQLETLRGEFRKPKNMRIHAGIDSTRMDIKQANRRLETLLEKYAEPMCSLDWVMGSSYPAALLRQAWKYLLQSQAHDSICCCCTDEALRSVQARLHDGREITEALIRHTSASLTRKVRTDLFEGHPLLVLNPYPVVRDEIVRATVLLPFAKFVLKDSAGKAIPHQVVSSTSVHMGIDPAAGFSPGTTKKTTEELLAAVGQRPDEPRIYFDQAAYVPLSARAKGIAMSRVVFLFPVSDLPPAGYRVYYLQRDEITSAASTELLISDRNMENRHLKVTINPDGTLSLVDKQTGFTYERLHLFEDSGDAGDEYNYSPPVKDGRITSEGVLANIEPTMQGPLCAGYKVSFTLSIPSGLSEDGQGRSEQHTELAIASEIRLHAGARYLGIHTVVENCADDHRVRVLFPTGMRSDCSFAEEQFGVIMRPNYLPEAEYWEKDGWVEKPLPIYPQQAFVDVNDGQRGLALLNRNLTEYEIVGGDESAIALTLFRGVGAMGRADLVIRPGRASGLEVPTPDALCHGTLEFEYAIFPHSGDHSEVAHQAALYNTPVEAIQTDRHENGAEPDKSFVLVEPTGLVVTCLKKAEWDEALILRLYNSTSQTVTGGRVQTSNDINEVILVDLKEEPLGDAKLVKDGDSWTLPHVSSSQILTLKLTPA